MVAMKESQQQNMEQMASLNKQEAKRRQMEHEELMKMKKANMDLELLVRQKTQAAARHI